MSRDGRIHLHDDAGRAPGLKAALEARGYRGLTVAFPYDDLADIIHQSYAAYSASALLWKGDAQSITRFGGPEGPVRHPAGTPGYEGLLKDPATKVTSSIYFALAQWEEDDTASIVWPDGFGFYRIRTTSAHSVGNLVAEYRQIKRIWKGPFMGIPFDVSIVQRQGVGPDGKKRSYPTFAFTMKPRKTLTFTSHNLARALASANRAAAALALPPPPREGAEMLPATGGGGDDASVDEVLEAEFRPVTPADAAVEATPKDLRALAENKDEEAMKRHWFAAVKGTHLEDEGARRAFFLRHTDQESLKEAVHALRPEQFDLLVIEAQEEAEEVRKEAAAKGALADAKQYHPSVTPADAQVLKAAVLKLGVSRFDIYPLFSMLLSRAVTGRPDLTREDIGSVLDTVGRWDEGVWVFDEDRAGAVMERFDTWRTSDEAGEVLLG